MIEMDEVCETCIAAMQRTVLNIILPLSFGVSLKWSTYCNCRAAEALEREKLLASGSMSDITPHDLLQPHSDFHIRNRYLSRIGALVRLISFKK
jgi:hypothetical protein